MKILELRFQNLNSLYGEWHINFAADEYASSGIFAITGATGAGKSTILDAICLALYGTTPRLGGITASSNEIMSRNTGECFAEVVFEAQGEQFCCHWSQYRARKKVNGKLQQPKQEISCAITGKPIETQKKKVARVIEDKTGLDFTRFTRSVLLAQGGFDTFLRADDKDKSKILEQITGTEEYSQISLAVHEKKREEYDKLELLKGGVDSSLILPPEEEQQVRQNLERATTLKNSITLEQSKAEQGLRWLRDLAQLRLELHTLGEQKTLLEGEIAEFEPQANRLAKGERALKLEGDHAAITTLNQEQKDDESNLSEAQKLVPSLKNNLNKCDAELIKNEADYKTAHAIYDKALPLLRSGRSLDQHLRSLQGEINEGQGNMANLSKTLQGLAEGINLKQSAIAKAKNTLQQRTLAAQEELNKSRKELNLNLDGLHLREYRQQKESLLREMALREKIAELEEHRNKLVEGEECPLCGATHHPFASNTLPPVSEIEKQIADLGKFIARAEDLEQKCATLEQSIRTISEETNGAVVDLQNEVATLQGGVTSAREMLDQQQPKLDDLHKRYDKVKDDREKLLDSNLFANMDTNNLDTLEATLQNHRNNATLILQNTRDNKATTTQNLRLAEGRIATLEGRIDKRKLELNRINDIFQTRLNEEGFASKDEYMQARITADDLNNLATKRDNIAKRRNTNRTLREDRTTRLNLELAKEVTTLTETELVDALQRATTRLDEVQKNIANAQHQLTASQTAKERMKSQQTLVDKQQTVCRKWDRLHELIGSGDGTKFRDFAQGITFEIVIGHANTQLAEMTDRYLLSRDGRQPLTINIMDDYQGGDIRSVKNLSGGESFIVSLALALGLSKMSSHKVRIDSLFLDEGFGTLDEEALEIAIEALARLTQGNNQHSSGKLIGVISHVTALKERIGTQINILPQGGGKSTMHGTGVAQGQRP